ncbi:hypothetical protein T4A_13446 [Trichinella pseudospiralis]|uniref:Uncharacterized protein n=1 Tax=Trichinella pseudospiralis TaxID=6337 RepID=A0A0V1EFD4_TRIPS|nr:hypothetical protein T4A_13446 [Trichinella pseudospiralis]
MKSLKSFYECALMERFLESSSSWNVVCELFFPIKLDAYSEFCSTGLDSQIEAIDQSGNSELNFIAVHAYIILFDFYNCGATILASDLTRLSASCDCILIDALTELKICPFMNPLCELVVLNAFI